MLVLAISGSLRPASLNTALVHAARLIAPPGLAVTVYDGLGTLPHFNPDLDGEGALLPPVVAELRGLVDRADAMIICSPEYAHGVPGVLKNALDWLVSSVEFPGMPVALINTSLRSVHAHESLTEVLTTMSARLPVGASVRIPLLDRTLDAAGIAADKGLAGALRGVLDALAKAAEA